MANFPASGGSNIPWENLASAYCSPTGNDNNNGLGWNSAKEHIYNALAVVIAAGGGTVYVADGCSVGGPVTGQGIRLRADFMPDNNYFFSAAPGFQQIGGPLRIVGTGGQTNGIPIFYSQPMADFTGGDDRFNPAIWIVGHVSMATVILENLHNASSVTLGTRIGVDYDRLLNGAVRQIEVTNATRTGEETEYTVSLDFPITVSRAKRVSNVTTLTIPNPGLPWPNVRIGVPIVFTSGDADFPSGTYVLTNTNNFQFEGSSGALTWTVSYADAGPDVPIKDIADSSYETHGCIEGDLIDLTSDNEHFLGTQYTVSSVDADGLHITVSDVFGDGDADEDDIGTIARQERFFTGTVNTQCVNVGMNPIFHPLSSHGFDVGSSGSWRPSFYGCTATGLGTEPGEPRDELRMASILIYSNAGSVSNAGISAYFSKCSTSNAPLYLNSTQGYGQLEVHDHCGETSFVTTGLPTIQVDGNSFTSVYTDGVLGADSASGTPVVAVSGCEPSAVHCERSGLITFPCVGGDLWWTPASWKATSSVPNPWTYNNGAAPKVVSWADGRITGKHPGAQRAMGVLSARYKNSLLVPTDWSLNGATRTTGQLAPDGSNTAVKIDSAGDYILMRSGVTGDTWQVGGKFVLCGWVNADESNAYLPTEFFRVLPTGVTFNEAEGRAAEFTGPGWQFVSYVWSVATVSDSTPDIVVLSLAPNTKTIYYWGMTAFYIPASVNDNDAYETAFTMRHQPVYLERGMSGTMEGGKLVAHGGLGVDSGITKTVGVGSGQLTLTGSGTVYEPRYDEDGTTIIGWVALLQATINP